MIPAHATDATGVEDKPDPEATYPVTKAGTDTYIGDYYSAPCGWSTYNRDDISHREWHKRMSGRPPRENS